MTLQRLAEGLQRGDPDRFRALMAAPPDARAKLLPLYAFNLEVARAPWLTEEPLIAEMRLQWWRDTLAEIAAGATPRAHEVVQPLAEVIRAAHIPVALLDGLVEARRWDIAHQPFADRAALVAHLDRTGGALMWAAALALGAPDSAEAAVRIVGRAGALAAWFQAVPELTARGRQPLPDSGLEAIAALACEGQGWLKAAKAARAAVPQGALPALLGAWQAGPLLKMAARAPALVTEGGLQTSEFSQRWRLLKLSLVGP